MTDLTLAIRAALVSLLQANKAALGVETIAQHLPDGAPYPRLELEQFASLPEESKTSPDTRQSYHLHIWSRHDGDSQAWAIVAQLRSVLHRTTLVLPGGKSAHCQIGSVQMFRDPHADDSLYHGVVSLTIQP